MESKVYPCCTCPECPHCNGEGTVSGPEVDAFMEALKRLPVPKVYAILKDGTEVFRSTDYGDVIQAFCKLCWEVARPLKAEVDVIDMSSAAVIRGRKTLHLFRIVEG